MNDKPHNAGDEESVGKQRRKAKDAAELQRVDLMALLEMPEFRRYIWRHMTQSCGFPLRSPSNPNGSVQSLNIGMHDVARLLWAEIETVDPLAIPTMMRETFEAQQ